jgi:hypothetical protein
MEETQQQTQQQQTNQEPLKTNHAVRIIILESREQLISLISEEKTPNGEPVGFKLLWPFMLGLGEPNEEGDLPIRYQKWCPFTPVQEFVIKSNSVVTVAYPDNNILDNYIAELESYGVPRDKLFFEVKNGDNSEPDQATE